MQRWTDEQRKDWQEMLSHAKISLDSNCPLWEDGVVVSAAEHISYLEFHCAGLKTIMEQFLARSMGLEEASEYVDKQLKEEMKNV